MDVIETDRADVQVNASGTTSYVNNYKIMEMLGEGTFSKVYLCQNDSGNEFALKIINKSILKRKREYKRVDGKLVLSNAFQKVQREVAIMKKLAHANLVRLYEVIDSPADDKLFLVLELIRGGQIMYWDDKQFRYFARNTPTGVIYKDTARECLRDVVAALDFLHRNHICHRDIKPENILISGNQYKLADFGVAYMNEDEPGDVVALKLRSTEGTYHFLAPECTTGDEYDPYQVDVWALGVTMFTLLVGTLPFGSSVASLSDVMTSIREDPLVLPPEVDPECAKLLTQLLEKNPGLRITVQQLKAHPWISGSGDASTRRKSSMEVMVTQQEIEAAFTPVNNFILVMKLKMKMSSRLNNARKSLASCPRRAEAVPVSKHISVPSSELIEGKFDGNGGLTESKTEQMAPGELSQVATNRLQGRPSRIVESISETVGSLTASLTRRSSHFGAGEVPTTATPVPGEDSSHKAKVKNRSGTLLRRMSTRNSRSVRSLFSDKSQSTDNARAAGIASTEGNRDDLAPGKSDINDVSTSSTNYLMMSLNGNKSPITSPAKSDIGNSPNIHRLTKRKSASFRGFMRTIKIPEGESASESTSPVNRKKKRESLSHTDSSSDLSVQHAMAAELPTGKEGFDSKNEESPPLRRFSQKKSISFRALIATPKSHASSGGDVVRTEQSPGSLDAEIRSITFVEREGTASQANGIPSMSLTTTRPTLLSRRISRRISRSTRALNTLTDTTQRGKPTRSLVNQTSLPETSLAKDDCHAVNSTWSGDCSNETTSVSANELPSKPGSTNAPYPLFSQLSRRNSPSFGPMPQGSVHEGRMNEVDAASTNSVSSAGTDDSTVSMKGKSSSKTDSSSPPGLLSRRLSQRSPTSFCTLPTALDAPTEEANVKDGTHEFSPDKSDAVPVNTAARKTITETATPSPGSVSTSPISSLKMKVNDLNDEQHLQPLRKAKLPILDMNLSPISSPVMSPATSPRRATSSDNQDIMDESTPKRRSSSPSNTIGSARRVSLRVSPLPRNRSPRLDEEKPDHPDSSSSLVVSNPSVSAYSPPVHTSPSRRSTISGMPSPPSSLRKLQRNQSINSDEIEDPNSALMRMSSLVKVLEACITTDKDDGRRVKMATSPTPRTEGESETLVTPLTPNRRHHVQVPPLLRPEPEPSSIAISHELVEGDKVKTSQPRRKLLLQTQDSARVLQGGKRSTHTLEKHLVAKDKLATINSKACDIM